MLRTKCPANYIPPTGEEIANECQEHKIKQSAPDFIKDICQMMAGGSLKSLDTITEESTAEVLKKGVPQKTYRGANASYSSSLGNTGPTPQQVIDADIAQYTKFHTKVSGMIERTISMIDEVPGCTPLEKSINLLKFVQKNQPKPQKGKGPPNPGGGGQGSGQGNGDADDDPQSTEEEMEALEGMDDFMKGAKKLEQTLKDINELNDNELDMMSGEPQDPEDSNNPALQQKKKAAKKMKVAEDFTKADSTILDVSRKLNEFSKLKSKAEIKFTPNLEGETVIYRPMVDLMELNRVRQASWAIHAKAPTLFKYQALTGQLSVRERGNFTHYKQLLYMIIDSSGSMGGERYWKAGGVLMNRLKAVVKGDAKLIWRLFDDVVYEERYAQTVEDAYKGLAFMRDNANFHGGGTNFDAALSAAAKSIKHNIAKFGYIKPEIMIVTDGDGETCFTKKDLEGCVVHSVCVTPSRTPSLVRLAKETGGIYTNC